MVTVLPRGSPNPVSREIVVPRHEPEDPRRAVGAIWKAGRPQGHPPRGLSSRARMGGPSPRPARRARWASRSWRAAILGWLLLLAPHPTALAEGTDRPVIGLVLGGGGAAGVAHVGVVRALEELGIRPDVITGTSMGAIVGGLYAAGLTPDELQAAVTTIDWSGIFNDKSDRQLLHPLRRDSRIDPLSVQADLPVGIGAQGVQIDAGLIDAVKLNLTLRRLAAPGQGVDDFDDLAIPFRAVATDIVTGEAVVLGEGDLATAIRASMSIPALFPPVEIGGRLLVDGGVVNNLPVDVARALGAEIVIVSEIPGADVSPEDLRSFTAILGQTMSVMIGANSRAQTATLGPRDVHLVPDVGAVGMLAFEKAASTVSAGQAAVAANRGALEAIGDGRGPLPPGAGQGDPLAAEIAYDRLEISYDGPLDPRVIRARLRLPESGSATIAEIETALREVYGLGTLDNVTYRVDRADDGTTLVVQAEPLAAGRILPRLGLALSNVFGGDGDFTLAVGLDVTDLNPLGGRLEVDGALGRTDGVRLRFEQPLDYAQTFFLRPRAAFVRTTGTLFAAPDAPVTDVEVSRTEAVLDALWAPGNWGVVGLGLGFRHETSETENGQPVLLGESRTVRDTMPLSLLLDYDTLDDPDLPTRGIQVSTGLDFDLLDGAAADRIAVDGVGALSFGRNTISPFAYLEGGIDGEDFTPNFVGGFQRLSGFEEFELIGQVVGVAGLRYYRRFAYDQLFGKEAFFGGSVEYGGAYDAWGDLGGAGSFVAGSVFGGLQTSLGPLILGFGAAEGGQFSATLTLGTRF